MDTSDRDLIARVLSGDRDSFDALVTRHAGALWTTVRSALRNREDAHEVFQETWLRALRRLETLRDAGRLRPWLVTIALNLVRQTRRRQRVPTEAPDVLDREIAAGGVEASTAVARAEIVARVRLRVAGLPDRQREVVDLRMNHGLSHAEIGEILGIREDAARASYYHALRKLRNEFEDLAEEVSE